MLTFNLKKEWFDKIKSGEKTHEYRRNTDYWKSRLFKKDLNGYCVFASGYPSKDDTHKRLCARIKSITYADGRNTDLKINEAVIDIKFELLKEVQE